MAFIFFQDSPKTQILQTVVNRVIKSHHQIIIYGSGNDFLLFLIDIFPLKSDQALLSNTDAPSVAANGFLPARAGVKAAFTTTCMEVPWHLCCQQKLVEQECTF